VVLAVGLSLLGVFWLLPPSTWRQGVYDVTTLVAVVAVSAMVWAWAAAGPVPPAPGDSSPPHVRAPSVDRRS